MLECAKCAPIDGAIPLTAVGWRACSPQLRVVLLVAGNVLVVALSGWVQDFFLAHGGGRLPATPPRWWFTLAQAACLGFVLTTAVPDWRSATVQAILAGVILGYTYALVGAAVIDERLALARIDLVFQSLELGCVCAGGMAVGVMTRLVGRWQLTSATEQGRPMAIAQHSLADLLELTAVLCVGLALFQLFLDDELRDAQVGRIATTVAMAGPAALVWLWGVSQDRLSAEIAMLVLGSALGLLMVLALTEYALTTGEFTAILEHAGQRTAALTFAATVNGLALRGLGFSWHRG